MNFIKGEMHPDCNTDLTKETVKQYWYVLKH